MRKFVLIAAILIAVHAQGQKFTTLFEQSKGAQTPNYFQIIDWWKKLDAASSMVSIKEMGPTDAGYPLHLILVSSDGTFSIPAIKAKGKSVILINNGIHPGEPDGIDASMLLVRDFVEKKQALPANVVLAIIPVYNIGGCLNRSENYRVDQDGPEAFGFRGNSQNLDLNRDFIKADSREALSFTEIFHLLDPDIFVDNHVSNGADYQHVMTLLSTQHNKLGGELGTFLNTKFEPALYSSMKTKGYDLVPYVNHFGDTPDKGWSEFWDSPRYGSGYGTLWNTFSFVPETHMLKPYPQRVAATKALMECFISFASANARQLISLRTNAKAMQRSQDQFTVGWKLDRSKSSQIMFRGYEAGYKTSEVSGQPRLYYDRNKPFEKNVTFYNTYVDTAWVKRPSAYLIPQGWWKVIDRLRANGIKMKSLSSDTTIEVTWYHIDSYQSSQRPYEGHHPNNNIQVSERKSKISFRKGDWLIPMNQEGNRFLIETLEPTTEDSYFTWNFFDAILGQKEGFSDYVFEDRAAGLLKTDVQLRNALEKKRMSDSSFAKNGRAQLNFVFMNSPYFEPAYLQYPVFRINR